MNTIRSTWIGWGVLIVAGGGSYYFAKRSINADKKARHEADVKRRRLMESIEFDAGAQAPPRKKHDKGIDHANSPSIEASSDPAPIEHTSESAEQQHRERSKYEPSEPFRAKKGDRFS